MTPHEQAVELLPCPFCGGESKLWRWNDVSCINEACPGSMMRHCGAEKWNRRATDAAPLAALAMRDAAALCAKNSSIRWHDNEPGSDPYGIPVEDDDSACVNIAQAIRALPLPDETALTAAAMTLPKIKALVEMAHIAVVRLDMAGHDDIRDHLSATLFALPPASKGETE